MKLTTYLTVIIVVLFAAFVQSCKKDTNTPPKANAIITPSTGSINTIFLVDVSGSVDDEDPSELLTYRYDYNNDDTYDTATTNDTCWMPALKDEGDYVLKVEVTDSNGDTDVTTINYGVSNSTELIPAQFLFSYPTGINYESWNTGRIGRNIFNDLDIVTDHFRLIRTYHDAYNSPPAIDGTQDSVIKYVVANSEKEIELVLGTLESAAAILKNGVWGPGYMVEKSYTDNWVDLFINSFGDVATFSKHVKLILIGNELDMNGVPTTDPHFENYYSTWIPDAISNLSASLKAKGLNIPVSVSIANYPSDPTANVVSVEATKAVAASWSSSYAVTTPVVLYDQYTTNYGKDIDFGPVIKYFEDTQKILGSEVSVYVGETGYNADNGVSNQKVVVNHIYQWLDGQYSKYGKCTPLSIFMAFDTPANAGSKQWGIFEWDSATHMVKGIKDGIVIPAWSKNKM